MKFRALVAVLGLLVACTLEPEPPNDVPRVEQVQPASLNAPHGLQFKVVDDGSTFMKQLVEYLPVERERGVTSEIDRWRIEGKPPVTDFYLTASSPGILTRYVADIAASVPGLEVPADRELAFEQIAIDRWRTYLVLSHAELDDSSIAQVDVHGDEPQLSIELTTSGRRQFADLTTRIAGHKLAVLVDGTVASAPVVQGPITGGHASITFGPEQYEPGALARILSR